MLKEKGFDYVALGHIHKLDYNQEENQNIVYPGSPVSLGFDELEKHGMIVGDIEKEKPTNIIETAYLKLCSEDFEEHRDMFGEFFLHYQNKLSSCF